MTTTNGTRNAQNAKAELRQQAESIAGDIQGLGGLGKRAAEESIEEAALRARAAKEEALEKARDFEDQVVAYVKDQPLKSVLIAAGVGALASMWLRR